MGLKRGSLVKHVKHGLCYVGGTSKGRISLHDMTGKRLGNLFWWKIVSFYVTIVGYSTKEDGGFAVEVSAAKFI